MKTLTLDYSKWRAGGNGLCKDTVIGQGRTKLLNEQGFMCCLGQFALQCDLKDVDIYGKEDPSELKRYFADFNYIYEHRENYSNTALSDTLMSINDDSTTTYLQKVDAIRITLRDAGYELNVINLPEN